MSYPTLNFLNNYEFLNNSLRPKERNVFIPSYIEIQKWNREAFSSFPARNVVAMWKYKMSVQRQC